MKMKSKQILLLLGVSLLALPGCGSGNTRESVSVETEVSSSSAEYPVSVNENITTSSTYYEEPAEAADTGDAEGWIPEEIPEGTIQEAETGSEFQFTENGSAVYAVTIDSTEFTDRRSVVPSDTAEQVLLITYTYRSLNGEPQLVDDMSFRLYAGETACDSYNVADQITGDVSTEEAVTAEVCFSVPADAEEFTLYVVDNADDSNENYQLVLQIK